MSKKTRDLAINFLGGAALFAAVAGVSIAFGSAADDVAGLLDALDTLSLHLL